MRRATAIVAFLLTVAGAALSATEVDWLVPTGDGASVPLPSLAAEPPSPADELGYRLGDRFTHHSRVVEYLRSLASLSERVALWEYGVTYEGRPLVLVAISSAENIARLEQIRVRHLERLADLEPASADDDLPVVVWLSYGVHGNESSSTETALAVSYILATTDDSAWMARLEQVIVLIDPAANPDGRERYVSSYEARRGREVDPYPGASEHFEPWPGGRQNHYLVDLNRDWAWLTQRETRHRVREYRRWEPHVFVDFHEMSHRSTYFFPPAAEPVHPAISSSTVRWLETFGRANGRAFDDLGWSYYVAEDFDLFYPGYGDTYPSLRGAIGMTYEVAGHGRAGLAVERVGDGTLSLSDRIARHLQTSLTTVATAVDNRRSLRSDFELRRRKAASSDITIYLWDGEQPEAGAAAALLAAHGLEPRRLTTRTTFLARTLTGGDDRRVEFAPGTYFLTTDHPLASLAKSLIEPRAQMSAGYIDEQRRRLDEDLTTEFFDITAWSLPQAFALEVFSMSMPSPVTSLSGELPRGGLRGEGDFGFLLAPQGLAGYRVVSALLSAGIRARLALAEFSQRGRSYERGTVFIPTRGNPENLANRLDRLASAAGVFVDRTNSSRTDRGISLGSNSLVSLRKPRIGLLEGSGVNPPSLGFLWHLLDIDLEVPHHRLDLATLGSVPLADFDVLVMPSGDYALQLDKDDAERLSHWIDEGGILVGIGKSVDWLQEHELTAVEIWEPEQVKESEGKVARSTPDRRQIDTPGATLATRVAPRPLTAGLTRSPAVLFRGRIVLLPTGNPASDLIVADSENPVLTGFAWPEAEERIKGALLLSVEKRKRGAVVIFAQEPVFRLFWRATAPPLLNALLYGPSLAEGDRLHE